jgi:uncharacterized membrane protein
MNVRLLRLWDELRTNFWFVPTMMAVLAVLLSFATITLDNTFKDQIVDGFALQGPEGARTLLSTVASSVITVAGVTFSITIATLTQAASQFGSRLLRNFMRDRGNQVVLGTFISTFLYCMLILRAINETGKTSFVPHLSVTIGMGLGTASLGVLIYFIHHISSSLQADHIIHAATSELEQTINHLFPEQLEQHKSSPIFQCTCKDMANDFHQHVSPIVAPKSGYLQNIETDRLLKIATRHDLLFDLKHLAGDFIIQGEPLLLVSSKRGIEKKRAKQIHRTCPIGMQRTPPQDIRFAVTQVVEVAVRAVSPAINDPFTAITCLDWLGMALCHLDKKRVPSPPLYDQENHVRVIIRSLTFDEITDVAFDKIRHASQTNVAVITHLLETIGLIAAQVQTRELRSALLRHANLVAADCLQNQSGQSGEQAIKLHYQAVMNQFSSENT